MICHITTIFGYDNFFRKLKRDLEAFRGFFPSGKIDLETAVFVKHGNGAILDSRNAELFWWTDCID
jgi:hypothetical protein